MSRLWRDLPTPPLHPRSPAAESPRARAAQGYPERMDGFKGESGLPRRTIRRFTLRDSAAEQNAARRHVGCVGESKAEPRAARVIDSDELEKEGSGPPSLAEHASLRDPLPERGEYC